VSAVGYRYRSPDEDSSRWLGFRFRDGDIVISTRSKSGTTWVQMICALLILQTPDLPAPLAELSPWLDWLVLPEEQLFAALDAQQHQRFIKTHTPLDGIPDEPNVTYIVVARHPLDMAASLYYQSMNLDRNRMAELTGNQVPDRAPQKPLADWLLSWIQSDADPRQELDSLPGVMWHYRDAWSRRHRRNVVLMHYDDLRRDLPGQMRSLAARLSLNVPEAAWPALCQAATFDQMKARADQLVPDPSSVRVLKDHEAFFRQGTTGVGRKALTRSEQDQYQARAAQLAPPDLLAWLHDATVPAG
jgi:aryl sulfotransferase